MSPGRAGDDVAGVALRGRVWVGGPADPRAPIDDGIVVVDATGTVVAVGPVGGSGASVVAGPVDAPDDVPVLGGPGWWVGPAVRDAHVHLAFGEPAALLAGGVVAARDLGAPLSRALAWRAECERAGGPSLEIAGEILTAPTGYPSRSWGADGFARFVAGPDDATAAVAELAAAGVDVVKLAFEPRGGPVLDVASATAAVAAASGAGLPTIAHALTVPMVERALDAGVGELAHLPTEWLPPALVDRIVAEGVTVTTTLWTFVSTGDGDGAVANARALIAAGARLRYGTDLGNAGTRVGVEPNELRLLADAGLGMAGALRLATAPWRDGSGGGAVAVGDAAALVALDGDPLADPDAWRRVRAVVSGGRVVRPEG